MTTTNQVKSQSCVGDTLKFGYLHGKWTHTLWVRGGED